MDDDTVIDDHHLRMFHRMVNAKVLVDRIRREPPQTMVMMDKTGQRRVYTFSFASEENYAKAEQHLNALTHG